MKTVIVCPSVSHGNTRRIAEVMGEILEVPVVAPSQVDVAELSTYDLVGPGSGIFLGSFHAQLREFVQSLPEGPRRRAFVFATSGFPEARFQRFSRPLVAQRPPSPIPARPRGGDIGFRGVRPRAARRDSAAHTHSLRRVRPHHPIQSGCAAAGAVHHGR